MRIVEHALEEPGCCALSGTSQGPFLELDRTLGPEVANGGTAYVSVQAVEAMAWQLGLARPDLDHEATVARLTAERDEARDAHYELLQAVGTTLQYGAIVKRGAIELRKPYDRLGRIISHKPGGKRKGVNT